ADGGDQPRWRADLFHQLSVQYVGRPVLSAGGAWADGHGTASGRWRHCARPGVLRGIRDGLPRASGPARRGRLLYGFVLLPIGLRNLVQPLVQSLGHYPWAWLAIVTLGFYHGVNPGMGWLFAVSNGMQAHRSSAVFGALPSIALGHFLAMAAVLLPFVSLELYLEQVTSIRAAAGLLLVAFGLYKLLYRRHPRVLAHVGPTHLVAWSFLSATAH